MRNTVTRLKPRAADLGAALRAFLNGDASLCVDSLGFSDAATSLALKSRALLRLGRLGDVVSVVDSLRLQDFPHAYAGELLAIKALALARRGDVSAETVLVEARARAFSSGFAPVECEVEFASAAAAWAGARSDESLAGIERVLNTTLHASQFCKSERLDYIYNVPFWRSRAFDLRGLNDALRCEYAAQADSLAHAFIEFDRSRVDDVYTEARMLSNLAVLVRDLDASNLAAYVEDRAERVVWNPFTADSEFAVFQAICWNRARRGDHLGAFRELRRASSCAPSTPLAISAILDRSFLARELGEIFTAQEDLEYAVKLSRSVDWEAVPGNDRSILYSLARQLAATDVKQARILWNRFATLKSGISRVDLAARGDRRERADECSAHAALLIAEGQRARGVSLLLESLEIWTEVGYAWRAAAVAIDLADLTGEPRYFEIAGREAAKQPNSWLARRVAAVRVSATA